MKWTKLTRSYDSFPPARPPHKDDNKKTAAYMAKSRSVLVYLKNGEYAVSHWIRYGKRREWVDEGNPNWSLLSKGWVKYWTDLPEKPLI